LDGKPRLAILFATTQYDTESLVAGVCGLLGDVPLWGGSSSTGVFQDAGWITSEAGAASLMLLADRPAGVGVAAVGDGDGFAAGRTAAAEALKQLGGDATALLTLAFMGPEEEILRGIAAVAPGVPVVGGSASDHSPDGKFQQFANGHSYKNHFAIAAIGGPVGYAFTNGYRLTGKKATVTKATGRTLFELDGRRAMDVYTEWVARAESEIGGGALVSFSVQYPLLFHKDGITYSAHPVNSNPDGSMDFGAAMSPGMILELGEASVNGLIAEAGNAVHKAALGVGQPKGILLAHCGGRAIALGDRIKEIPAELEHTVGHLPLIGYLAFGEQGCSVVGIPTHADLSLSALVLG
ncbi:MAG: FIST N-terminal domain-containing protein, partial [Candidatus Limnocylindrales bacterium]|nr:FIST N-terminal domain-containing protein [Candidatus Limnocylindrales bacterium]